MKSKDGALPDKLVPSPTELQTLNFKVSDSFKRDYKVYAAQRGMTMLQLLRDGFDLSRQKDRGA